MTANLTTYNYNRMAQFTFTFWYNVQPAHSKQFRSARSINEWSICLAVTVAATRKIFALPSGGGGREEGVQRYRISKLIAKFVTTPRTYTTAYV